MEGSKAQKHNFKRSSEHFCRQKDVVNGDNSLTSKEKVCVRD
jgi:hypothetical protein